MRFNFKQSKIIKNKQNPYLLSIFIILLLAINIAEASEYGKCILKTKVNGCTRYFSLAWNTYINLDSNRLLYVSFAPASDENVQYFNTTHQSWRPDLTFTPGIIESPDYKLLHFSPDKHSLKNEGSLVAKIQVLDYAQSLNYNNKHSLWWSITRNDHEGKAWTIEFNYNKPHGTYHIIKAATNGKDSNLQCKVMYYSDELQYNYNSYYTDSVVPGLVDYSPVQNQVVGNNKEFNNLINEYKSSQPILDSCSIS